MSDKPPIRLKFREPEVATAPPAVGVTMAAQRSQKPPPTLIGSEKIIAKCGHTIAFDLYAKDPHRDGRRLKATSRDCQACRMATTAADVAAAADRKAKKAVKKTSKPRLPDGARFAAVYDAAVTQWSGTLTVEDTVVERRASGIKNLLDRLDDAYRATLPSIH